MKPKQNLETNKANSIAFYRTAFLGNPAEAVERYVGIEYIQHNLLIGNGKQDFVDYFEQMAAEYPSKEISFVHTIAKDDLVSLHTHQIWPNNEQYVTMDFFVLMKKEKLLNIGTPYREYLRKQRMVTACIN
ncbi:MAG TPA: hypothetical protein VLM20_02095 [Methylophilaceae bacterium]|nr:hypothetical protein [Methylophilaceae bacterium]